MRTRICLVLVSALLCGPGTASAQADEKTPRLVVFDLEPKGVEPQLARNTSEALLTALQSLPGYRVMGQREIKAILEHQGARQATGCVDDSCLAELGEVLKGDLILSGSLGLVGNAYLLNARLIDVPRATVVSRTTVTALSAAELPRAAGRAALELVAPERVEEQKAAYSLDLSKGELKLAVLDFSSSGTSKDIAGNLTQVAVSELKKFKGISVISKDEIKTMLNFEQDRQLLGCSDESCLAEIGGALGVEYLVDGNVGSMGGVFLIHLKLIDIREAQVENRVAESFRGEESQLLSAAAFATRKLIGHQPEGQGKLEVRPSVPDAHLTVDGKQYAHSVQTPLAPGKYNLRLQAEGFHPWIGDVYVDAGDLTRIDASLSAMPEKWYQKWWLWTTVGVVVAGGLALGLYLGLGGDQLPNTGTLAITAELPGHGR